MHTLVNKHGKTIFSSARKIDATYEHQKHFRRAKVRYVFVK